MFGESETSQICQTPKCGTKYSDTNKGREETGSAMADNHLKSGEVSVHLENASGILGFAGSNVLLQRVFRHGEKTSSALILTPSAPVRPSVCFRE